MTLINPSFVLEFVGSGTIPVTTVTNAEIVRESVEIDWQMMSDLKSTSDKAKISITKQSVAVSRIMSFDGDIKATLINKTGMTGEETLFTGFLSNKYKWSVTTHGEQVLALTIEDNTRLLETVYSDKDQLLNKEFYIPAKTGHPTASGILVDIAALCGITLDSTVPEVDVDIIKTVSADTQCVDILDQCCFELGYCYKFKADGKLYLWQIAKGDEPVSATIDKSNLYAYQENGVIVNKSLRQYNRAIVKYTEINERNNVLIYQDISGQDDTHPYCYIEVPQYTAYPSGLALVDPISGQPRTDDELKAVCDAADLEKGMSLIGIGDSITTEFSCTSASITADIKKYSAKQLSVLIKNNTATPVYILKLAARSNILYEEGETKIYAGSVSDKKFYDTQLEYVHDTATASKLGNLIYQFYKHSNLSYTFYTTTKLEIGSIIKLVEDVHTGIEAKLMINARVDSTTSDIYQYAAFSFSPFNLAEPTQGGSSQSAPGVVPTPKTMIQYALSDSPDNPPTGIPKVLGSASDKIFGSASDKNLGTSDGSDAQWSPSVPYPVPEGKYVWMRTSTDNGATWAYARLTGDKGDEGSEKRFKVVVGSDTFVQDRRRDGYQYISVIVEVYGYAEGTYTVGLSPTNATIDIQGRLQIPWDNSFSEVTVTATLVDTTTTPNTVIETIKKSLTPIDQTDEPQFLGCVSSMPLVDANNKKIIDGDYFCVKIDFPYGDKTYYKGKCYRRASGVWIELDEKSGSPTEFLNCLYGFESEKVDLSSISNPSSISWFNTIISNKLITNSLFAKIAEFDNLKINRSAIINGTIEGDYFKTNTSTAASLRYYSTSTGVTDYSFNWSDIQTIYATKYNSSKYGQLLSASGSFNGKTASKVVYHNSSSINSYSTFPNVTIPQMGIKTYIKTSAGTDFVTTYTTRLRITATANGGGGSWYGYNYVYYHIVDATSGNVEATYQIALARSADATATVTTIDIQSGKKIALSSSLLGGTATPYLYQVDNFGIGTNVITSDNWKYNIGGAMPTEYNSASLNNVTYRTIPTLYVESVLWDASSVQTYKAFNGKVSPESTVPDNGSAYSSLTRMGTAYIESQSSETTYDVYSATWSNKRLTIGYSLDGSKSITLDATSTDLIKWSIDFSTVTQDGSVISKGLLPWDLNANDLGANTNRWNNGYFNNLYSTTVNSTNCTATNLLGILGSTSDKRDAFINTLQLFSGLTYGSSAIDLLQPYKFEKWDDTGGLQGRIVIPGINGGSMKILYGYTSDVPTSSPWTVTCNFGSVHFTNLNYFVAGVFESPADESGKKAGSCTVKTRTASSVTFINDGGPDNATKIIWVAIGY